MAAAVAYRDATLGTPNATSTTWSLPPITLPTGGDWRFTATAYDTARPAGREPRPPAATGSTRATGRRR